MCWTLASTGRVLRGMFSTNHFTLPPSGGTLVASGVVNVSVAAMQLAVAQYQDAANVSIAPSRGKALRE